VKRVFVDTGAWIGIAVAREQVHALFRKYADHEFSIVDCASFVVARRHRVRDVFGFDSDFAAMGFVLRPSDHTGESIPFVVEIR